MKKPISLMFVLGLSLYALPSIAQNQGDLPEPLPNRSSAEHDPAATTITVPTTSISGVAAIDAERQNAKMQIDSSLPAKTKVSENMPPGGKIVVTTKDKQAAAALIGLPFSRTEDSRPFQQALTGDPPCVWLSVVVARPAARRPHRRAESVRARGNSYRLYCRKQHGSDRRRALRRAECLWIR